jgi:hypothetical protein
MLAYRNSH